MTGPGKPVAAQELRAAEAGQAVVEARGDVGQRLVAEEADVDVAALRGSCASAAGRCAGRARCARRRRRPRRSAGTAAAPPARCGSSRSPACPGRRSARAACPRRSRSAPRRRSPPPRARRLRLRLRRCRSAAWCRSRRARACCGATPAPARATAAARRARRSRTPGPSRRCAPVRVVAAIVCRSATSAISRFFWLTSSCWRVLSMPKPRSSGCA